MTASALAHVVELLDHLDRLKALHRANESPSFGQVELLFDLAAVVRASLAAPDPSARPAAWPTQATPVEKAARRLVELVAASLMQKGGVA